LKELFNGEGLFFPGLLAEEVVLALFMGDSFCFLASAELPELSLALRLSLPRFCAIFEDCTNCL
jgi:hypothetical protein